MLTLIHVNYPFANCVVRYKFVVQDTGYVWLKFVLEDTSKFHLTLSHNHDLTTLKKKAFETLWEKEKILLPAFSPFPTLFPTLPQDKFQFLSHVSFLVRESFQCGKEFERV